MAACDRGYEPVVRNTRVNISSRVLAPDVDTEGVGEVRLEVVALEERGGGAERSPVATMLSIQCLVSWIVIAVSRVKLIPRGTVLQSPYRGQEMHPDQRLVDRRDPTGG